MVDWNARLREAVRAGNAKRVAEALARGAKVDGGFASADEAANGDEARTPLHVAAEAGSADVVRALLEAGADVNARDAYGNTPLRSAAAVGTLEVVKLLLAAGADPLVPGRMTLNALDRARERRTPEGRMITAFFERWLAGGRLEASAKPSAVRGRQATRGKGGGDKPLNLRR